ncbi:MAG: cyclic nucleotide-binding domain-containing protein [Gammaproteobacteria bacterium]
MEETSESRDTPGSDAPPSSAELSRVPHDHPYLASDAGLIRHLSPIDELPVSYQGVVARRGAILVIPPGDRLSVEADEGELVHYLLGGSIGIEARGRPRLRLDGTDAAAQAPVDPGVRPFRLRALGAEPARIFRIERSVLDRQLALAAQGRPAGELDVAELNGDASDDWVSRTLRNGVLAALPPERILQVLLRATEMAVSAGQVIITQGMPGDYYYLVKSGRARVERRVDRAGMVHLAEIGPGDGVGEEALVADGLRNATVTMLTDGVLLRLERSDFHALVRDPLLTPLTRARADGMLAIGARWLDVRYEDDYAQWHLDDALNLPLPLIRLQYHRLDPEAHYVVYSEAPEVSAVAALLLRLRGIEASHVDAPIVPPVPPDPPAAMEPAAAQPQETTMSNDAFPSVLDIEEDAAARAPERPEHYADTYTGQSLAQLVEEIHSSGIAPGTAEPAPVQTEEPPAISLDSTVFRVDRLDDDEFDVSSMAVPGSAPTNAADDAVTRLLGEFEQRLRNEIDAVREAERARFEARFATRVGQMRKRAEEVVREKLVQARARDRERLAERERELDDYHARLAALANRVTHQKARIQEARNALAEKLAAVESLHHELNSLGQSVTRQLDELDSLTVAEAPRTSAPRETELDQDRPPGIS